MILRIAIGIIIFLVLVEVLRSWNRHLRSRRWHKRMNTLLITAKNAFRDKDIRMLKRYRKEARDVRFLETHDPLQMNKIMTQIDAYILSVEKASRKDKKNITPPS